MAFVGGGGIDSAFIAGTNRTQCRDIDYEKLCSMLDSGRRVPLEGDISVTIPCDPLLPMQTLPDSFRNLQVTGSLLLNLVDAAEEDDRPELTKASIDDSDLTKALIVSVAESVTNETRSGDVELLIGKDLIISRSVSKKNTFCIPGNFNISVGQDFQFSEGITYLPSMLGYVNVKRDLVLSGNQIGYLPDSFGKFVKVGRDLDLARNQITPPTRLVWKNDCGAGS